MTVTDLKPLYLTLLVREPSFCLINNRKRLCSGYSKANSNIYSRAISSSRNDTDVYNIYCWTIHLRAINVYSVAHCCCIIDMLYTCVRYCFPSKISALYVLFTYYYINELLGCSLMKIELYAFKLPSKILVIRVWCSYKNSWVWNIILGIYHILHIFILL